MVSQIVFFAVDSLLCSIESHAMNAYGLSGPTHEFGERTETRPEIRNIGWTLGNYCPNRCSHCYSKSARQQALPLSHEDVINITQKLKNAGVKTVNLGGNEPAFTNGKNLEQSLLPFVINEIASSGMQVGLTTSGVSLLWLYYNHRDLFFLLNDVDISIDSPYKEEHDASRGSSLFSNAIEALKICMDNKISHTCIMCAMNWNFTERHIKSFVELAKYYEALVRVNPLRPIVSEHMAYFPHAKSYFEGFLTLSKLCYTITVCDPPLSAASGLQNTGRCPCGRTSLRIHSRAPDGGIYASPCVYTHDYLVALDLCSHDLHEIIYSPQFRVFRQRHNNPHIITGCSECTFIETCGGGCAARAHLYTLHALEETTMLSKDPYCIKEDNYMPKNILPRDNYQFNKSLVHMDYLCTWIGVPK